MLFVFFVNVYSLLFGELDLAIILYSFVSFLKERCSLVNERELGYFVLVRCGKYRSIL